MFFQEKSKQLLVLVLLFGFLFSCDERNKKTEERWKYYNEVIDTTLVKNIWRQANDTIKNWIDLDLYYWAFNLHRPKRNWRLCKIVLLNTKRNKSFLYTAVRTSKHFYPADRMPVIIGEKYKGSWWFYPGPSYHIPREDEKKKIPSFEYLEYRARRIAMGWYYKEERKSFGDCNNFLLKFDFDGYNQCRKLNYTINDVAFESEFSTKSRTEEYDEPHERIEGYLQWISNPENKYIPEKK